MAVTSIFTRLNPLAPKPVDTDMDIVIVGAGFSGLGMAIQLKDAGIENLSVDPDMTLQKFEDRFRLDLMDEDAERYFLSLINESLGALVPVVLERFHKIAVWMR